jgi:hypothetical protein
VDQKYVGSFEMRCRRRIEKIGWTDCVRNEGVLHRVKEERNILQTVKIRKGNWIDYILRRICLLQHVIEGKIQGRMEVTGRRGRRRKKLLDGLKEKRGYWKLIKEAVDRTLWRTLCERGCGRVLRPFFFNSLCQFTLPLICAQSFSV